MTGKNSKSNPQNFYDQIADVHHLMMKLEVLEELVELRCRPQNGEDDEEVEECEEEVLRDRRQLDITLRSHALVP